ncbi:hypothetical protein C0989_002854 [Termitomyces sp. Mn162]|nr:hypothetical protein C0989_002854 [Termitomyces sp. Mn162]
MDTDVGAVAYFSRTWSELGENVGPLITLRNIQPSKNSFGAMVSESDELVNFQRSLVAFTYAPSPRKFDTSSGLSALSRPSKRSLQSSTLAPAYNEQFDIEGLQAPGDTPGSSPKRKRARGYADPEVYAHLQGLPDILSENLDSERYHIKTNAFLPRFPLVSHFLWH